MILILYTLMGTSLVAGATLGVRLAVLLHRFTRRQFPDIPDDPASLPTVTVCVPARNETHAMTQCLERVIACSYPKLEVLVLDDNSADNTSILIKSFAHAGVRFVEGAPLPDGWLGKNHAQHELYKRASGEYLLFLDVDTHLSPYSIERMIATSLAENATMISVLPTRDDSWRTSTLFATLRHFRSIITHTNAHPAATSNTWLIQRDFLEQRYDGLAKLRMAVSPEQLIARQLAPDNLYRFYISTSALGVTFEKKWRSQCETAIRLLYPFFGGSAWRAGIGLFTLVLFVLPFLYVPTALFISWTLLHSLALLAASVMVLNYSAYTARVWRSNWLIGGLVLPCILIQELILLCMSIYAYAVGSVTWKGRPIRQTAHAAARPSRKITRSQ